MKDEASPDLEAEETEVEELFEHHRLIADPGQQPLRVDKFVSNLIGQISRSKLQLAAKSGYVRVNGESVKSNFKVKSNDVVTIELPKPIHVFKLIPEEMDLEILHEDSEVLVLVKPAGMVVHPGNGNYTGTLVHGVAWHLMQQQLDLQLTPCNQDLL